MSVQDFHIGGGDVKVDGVSVGHTTQEGVVITYEPDVHLHMSAKYGSTPVKASLVGQKLEIKMVLAESTKNNMETALAGTVQADGKVKFGGVAGAEIAGVELEVVPFDGTSAWLFRNAVPTSSVEVAYQPDNERVYAVTFTAMVDESFSLSDNVAYVS